MRLVSTLVLSTVSASAFAAPFTFKGSDTLAGLMTDAIQAAGLQDEIQYAGGGSGKGEEALVAGQQGIAPMSREMKKEAAAKAVAAGINPVAHPIALDGIGVFVNRTNVVGKMSLPLIKSIFTCQITDWSKVPASQKVGTIEVFRRDDASGTTDTFKSIVGVKEFGPCVKVLKETTDIANETSNNPNAVGYAGLSATRDGNRPVTISKDDNSGAYLPTVHNIRKSLYPLARTLYVYEATGSYTLNSAESKLLPQILDRSFMDPIVQQNDFITLD
ncbi:MAG: PstS family phosphate ABC transporter substrate-binding protein [Silvanigrellaceae bacterium]